MKDLKLLFDYFRTHKLYGGIVIAAAVLGAFLGVLAYYNGWLG